MNKIHQYILFVLVIMLSSSISMTAQLDDLNDNRPAIQDTTETPYVKSKEGTFKKLFQGKPGKAALYGLIIPGGGQFYNRKYFSGVIAASIDIGILIYLVDRKLYFNQLNDYYLCLLNETGCTSIFNTDDVSLIRNARNGVRQEVEYGYLYMAVGHFLTVIWAYVQAHLIDFDDSDDLSFDFKLLPAQVGTVAGITPTFGLTIPLNKKKKSLADYRLVQP